MSIVRDTKPATIVHDMALSRSDAIDKCQGKGREFIKHFEKIYDEPNSQATEHWVAEMQAWFDSVRAYKLKESKKPILFGELRDWFFTACAEPGDFMSEQDEEKKQAKLEAYDGFVNRLAFNPSVALCLKAQGVLR